MHYLEKFMCTLEMYTDNDDTQTMMIHTHTPQYCIRQAKSKFVNEIKEIKILFAK